MSSKPIKQVETKTAIISLRADKIINVHFKDGVTVESSDQYKYQEIFQEMVGNIKHRFLYTAEGSVIVTKEAREAASLLEEITPVIANAVIASNLPLKLFADFYIKFHKPKTPHKVFTSVDKGIEWLKTF